jgi:CheY-like chemotaxis protein
LTVSHGLRILSVEDEPLNRVLLRAVLSNSNDARFRDADVVEATTVAEGRQRLADTSPDLVLLDRRLPDGDGLELARETLNASAGRPVFVAVTADAVAATHAAAAAAGCAAVVVKPYLPAELMAVLTRALEGSLPAAPVNRA